MHKYTAVIFDFDGTIAYTAKAVWNSLRYGFEKAGLVLPQDYSSDDRNLANTVYEMVENFYPQASDDILKIVADGVNEHYRYLSEYPDTVLYPHIRELLLYLKSADIPTGILSNKGHYSLGRILKTKDWMRYFTSYCGVKDDDEEVKEKGDRLKDYLTLFDTTDCIYIGDSAGDVRAAEYNKIPCIGVLYGDGDKRLVVESKPDYICETPADLLKFFEEH